MVTLELKQKNNLDLAPELDGVRVLLVEDEPDITDLLVFVLETAGAEVTACMSAETALALIEPLHPDILLCNIRLPFQNGDWLIQQIRTHGSVDMRQLPAIALTSYTREVSKLAALNAGFDCFVTKFENSIVDEIVHLLSTYSHRIRQRSPIANQD